MTLEVAPAPPLAGALLVDKPQGPTSHDIVAFVRRTLRTSRVGHTGTLDPLATGLLVVLVGPATRMAQFLAADEKEYVADVRFGVATPTYDAASLADGVPDPTPGQRWTTAGEPYPITDSRNPMRAELEAVLDRFRGAFLQTPPQFSAKKVAGVAAYEKARRNESVELKPVAVTVRELQLLPASETGTRTSGGDPRGLIRLRVAASAGFYVRSLAHDIGQALGCGAHLEALRRTRVGRFGIEAARTLDLIERDGAGALITMNELLGEMPAVTLDSDLARRATHGNPVLQGGGGPRFDTGAGRLCRLVDASGALLAVAEARGDGLLHPLVVLG